MNMDPRIPVIDLFAGPGGLGEGFSTFRPEGGAAPFNIRLSVEKEHYAHQTLQLRSFLRQFPPRKLPSAYYDFLRNIDIPFNERINELYGKYPAEAETAQDQAWHAELGEEDQDVVRERISIALGNSSVWILLGGPPCQAYSVAGRSRNHGIPDYIPEEDKRQYLYQEYLKVIAEHKPTMFIMENVKGLLSATLKNQRIFELILEDLKDPVNTLKRENRQLKLKPSTGDKPRYKLYTLVPHRKSDDFDLRDYVVEMERYGVPQARHRVILLGIKEDMGEFKPENLKSARPVSAGRVLKGLPRLRGGLTDHEDTSEIWFDSITDTKNRGWFEASRKEAGEDVYDKLVSAISGLEKPDWDRGAEFIDYEPKVDYRPDWFLDDRLEGVCHHSTRAHISKDLHRYLYAACYARVYQQSPNLKNFPKGLLPAHNNVPVALNGAMFADRFRVQLSGKPATTVMSHIAKDGHYYIHYDPTQCRSLTVREVARLQTFQDNYFFCGPRTSQYIQVGNAVPPLLANQIAEIVYQVLRDVGVIR
ncbi:DNA cytosine methyltransferase [candidate division KSB1 bacterium]